MIISLVQFDSVRTSLTNISKCWKDKFLPNQVEQEILSSESIYNIFFCV